MFSAVLKGAPLGNKNAAGKHKAGGLKSHPNYTESDHKYLKGKGYSDAEIKAIWDRDAASGNSGLVHGKTPLQAELDKKGPAGWGNGLPTKNTPLKKGEAMFASVLKSNPKGINQYTKGGGKSADPARGIESKVSALDTEMETLTKQIDKQKDGATPEQMAKMKSIAAKRRDLMKANASATAASPYSAPYKPTPFLSQKADLEFSGFPCSLGVVQKSNPKGINQYTKNAMKLVEAKDGLNWTGNHGKGSVQVSGDEILLKDTHAHQSNADKAVASAEKDWAEGGAYHSYFKEQGVDVQHLGSTSREHPAPSAFASYQSLHRIKVLPPKAKKAEAAFSGYPCDLGVVQKANPEGINQYSKGTGASSAQSKAYLETQLSKVQAQMRSGTSSRLVMAGWRKKEAEYKNALASFHK